MLSDPERPWLYPAVGWVQIVNSEVWQVHWLSSLLGKAMDLVQQLGWAVGWALQLDSNVGLAPSLARVTVHAPWLWEQIYTYLLPAWEPPISAWL